MTAFFAVITGFAMIWHIWWLAGLGVVGGVLTLLAFMFRARRRSCDIRGAGWPVRSVPPGGGFAMTAAVYVDDVRDDRSV